ncbi:lysine-arginine-ornithine-binding protein [Rhodoligotrophos appendicifer]|uniref:transporter substrate-binding domain-containing protein n=1 Tax=Rhodoligotrophos appendicifer TaxID=987056 RepID=UPI0014782AFC|nr:transporter substrate-binding domain-containing protein [Rhodoligotrophos appendicifer]
MKQLKAALTWSVVACGLALGCVSAIAAPLSYCVEADLPPFSYKTAAGAVEGFDVDIASAICTKIGRECDPVIQEWTGIIPALYAGKCETIISSMTITDQRKKVVLFTDAYYHAPWAFIARKGLNMKMTPEGLKGRTLCMFKNSGGLKYLEENLKDVAIKYYDGADAIRTDLVAGRCDGWFEQMPIVYGSILSKPEGKDFEVIGDLKIGQGVGIAVKTGDTELAGVLNEAVKGLYADGTFKKINDKYFPFSLSRE